MSSQHSTAPTGEKVFRFISDPGHKETLSGRVRAACLTCRRKKIKCSGEEPCQTCLERGLACDGLPPRKRPRRQQEFPWAPEQGSLREEGIDGDSQASDVSKKPTRPRLKMVRKDTSHDSGYSSFTRDTVSSASPPEQFSPVSRRSSMSSTSTLNQHTSVLALNDYAASTDDGETGKVETFSFITDVKADPARAAMFVPHDLSGLSPWPAYQSPGPAHWKSESPAAEQDSTSLISAARALEDQAQSLRKLASRQVYTMPQEPRRQTVAFPVTQSDSHTYQCPPAESQGDANDLAILFPGCMPTPRAHAGPVDNYFPPWLAGEDSGAAMQPPSGFSETNDRDDRGGAWRSGASAPMQAPSASLPSSTRNRSLSNRSSKKSESQDDYMFSKARQRPWPY